MILAESFCWELDTPLFRCGAPGFSGNFHRKAAALFILLTLEFSVLFISFVLCVVVSHALKILMAFLRSKFDS